VTELSVLIATHNRRDLLRRCLDSLCNQTAAADSFEVIIADDGSSDGSAEAAERLTPPYRLRVLRLEQGGQPRAQNAAIAVAEGSACLFLDDDVIASPELVAEHIAVHRDDPVAVGVGALTQRPPAARDWYASMFARSWNAHYNEFESRAPTWIDCYGANISAPQATLNELGGVATDLDVGFDLELGYRLCEAGCQPVYLPKAHGVHDDQKRGQRMLEDARKQGASHVQLARRLPAIEAGLLDWSGRAGPGELALRRVLLALRFPPGPLVAVGARLPGVQRRVLAFSIIKRLVFWSGAADHLSRDEWKRVTHGRPL
jgi:glycosyltransferase involved in cell wall biosynthesis